MRQGDSTRGREGKVGLMAGLYKRERLAFQWHLVYAVFDGICLGLIALYEFVFIKQFQATSLEVALLFTMATLFNPIAFLCNDILIRIRHRKRFLVRLAAVTRLPLLLLLVFPTNAGSMPAYHLAYIVIFALYYVGQPFLLPAINGQARALYAPKRYGRLYGIAISLALWVSVLVTYLFGRWLEVDPQAFRWAYAIMAVAGFAAVVAVVRMPIPSREGIGLQTLYPLRSYGAKRVREFVGVLRANRPFLHYQAGMMLYGFGFLMGLPVFSTYISRHFGLGYEDLAFYKLFPLLISISTIPLFARKSDGVDPRRLSALVFGFNGGYFLLLLLSTIPVIANVQYEVAGLHIYPILIVALVSFGLFLAGINISWNIGSAYFAPNGLASTYHAIHVTLTGLRGLVAPIIGMLLADLLPIAVTFSVCLLFQIGAITVMLRSFRRQGALRGR